MSWTRTDDRARNHPKMLRLTIAEYGYWHAAKEYASEYLTNGFIPVEALGVIYHGVRATTALKFAVKYVECGLWEKREGGWQIHDYLDYHPSRDEILAERRQRHEAKARAGRLGGLASGVSRRANGEANAKQTGSNGSKQTGSNGQEHDEADAKQQASTGGKQNEAPARPVPVVASFEATPETPNGVLSGTLARPPAAHRAAAIEVLEFLNAKTGRSYEAKHPDGTPTANLRFIEARLKAGASVEDCKGVIARKVRQWLGDPKMAEYLRPKTLFNQTNFDTYLGERERDDA